MTVRRYMMVLRMVRTVRSDGRGGRGLVREGWGRKSAELTVSKKES